MGVEFELKFRATPETLDKIKNAYPGGEEIRMQTTYYDTPEGSLSAKRFTLRRRQENEESVCTLKTPGDGLQRGEFEIQCESLEKAVPELCKLSGEYLPAEKLEEVCGARFIRYAKQLILPGCTLELAADAGVLLGGGKEQPLYEIEVELKSGSEESVTAFARELAKTYDLQEEERSKFVRALELANDGRF